MTNTQPTTLSLNSTKTDVSCTDNADGSINLASTGGTMPYTYIWSNGATTQDISSLISGTYAVTVTDAQNCTANASVTITQPTALLTSVNITNTSCDGGTDGALPALSGFRPPAARLAGSRRLRGTLARFLAARLGGLPALRP